MALAERANQVDRMVSQAADDLLFPTIPDDLALVAVGGYGRRQLFPFSDVDLLLLFRNDELPRARKPEISAFLQRLWDSGLRVSQSVPSSTSACSISVFWRATGRFMPR
jgi:[protein-PII] uridylyltransferase